MSTTKSDLIELLSARARLPRPTAEIVIDIVFDQMIAAMKRGERIEIRGFGSFEVRDYKSYQGRNPRTGESVHVPPKKLPFFKVGKELRERVNSGGTLEVEREVKAAPVRTTATAPKTAAKPSPRRRDETLSEDVI